MADGQALHFKFVPPAIPPALRAAVDRVPGSGWERAQGSQVWRCPLGQREAALGLLRGLPGTRCTITPPAGLEDVPLSILEAAGALPDDSARYADIPQGLEQALMPFQRQGVRFALGRGGRVLIGDEMGLGKTVQAIALLAAYRDEWPCLIIAPASLREQWQDALHQWLQLPEDAVHSVRDKGSAHLSGRHAAYIVGTTSAHKLQDALMELGPRVVVLDESHKIKSAKAHSIKASLLVDELAKRSQAQCTKALLPVLQAASRAILLTGTAALARPIELRPQLEALLPPRLGAAARGGSGRGRLPKTLPGLTEKAFGERYCKSHSFHVPNRPYPVQLYNGACNLEELNRLLTASVMIRRRKQDVLAQLPPKRRQQVYLPQPEGERAQLKKLADSSRQQLAAAGRDKAEQRSVGVQWFNACAPIKAKAVAAYVEELLERDQKFLIFAHHTCMLDAIEYACNQWKGKEKGAKPRYIRIDGKVDPTKRHSLVQGFQERSDLRVAILSTAAAGTGLTLTNASVVVFAEYSWTPGDLLQAEDRAHRIGQARAVNVYYLHMKGSVDDLMWRTIRAKLENVGQVLNGEEDRMDFTSASQMAGPSQPNLSQYLRPIGGPSQAGAGPPGGPPPVPQGPAGSSASGAVQGAGQAPRGHVTPPGAAGGGQRQQQQRGGSGPSPQGGRDLRSYFGKKPAPQPPQKQQPQQQEQAQQLQPQEQWQQQQQRQAEAQCTIQLCDSDDSLC